MSSDNLLRALKIQAYFLSLGTRTVLLKFGKTGGFEIGKAASEGIQKLAENGNGGQRADPKSFPLQCEYRRTKAMPLEYFNTDSDTADIVSALRRHGAAVVSEQIAP